MDFDLCKIALVDPVSCLATTCSTSACNPSIPPKQNCLGRIPGVGHGVGKASAVSKACSTQEDLHRSSGNLPWLNSVRPPGSRLRDSHWESSFSRAFPMEIPMGVPHGVHLSPWGIPHGDTLGGCPEGDSHWGSPMEIPTAIPRVIPWSGPPGG